MNGLRRRLPTRAWTLAILAALSLLPAASPARATERLAIDALETVTLGGLPQAVQLRGRHAQSPVLLFLHGGPGNSEMTRGYLYGPPLEKHFIVVHWDQRGAGRSHSPTLRPADLTLQQMITDTLELRAWLRRRLGDVPVALLGHSWGSILGVHVVHRAPAQFCAYVGMGQLTEARQVVQAGLTFARSQARAAGDAAELAQLPPLRADEVLTLKRLGRTMGALVRYGGALRGQHDSSHLHAIEAATPRAPLDRQRSQAAQAFSLQALAPAMLAVDLPTLAPALKLPVVFLLGRHDHLTDSALAAAWLERLDAPHKKVVWFERSAHWPQVEEPARFADALLTQVRPLCPLPVPPQQPPSSPERPAPSTRVQP